MKTIRVVTTLIDSIFITRRAITNHNAETLQKLNAYLADITHNSAKFQSLDLIKSESFFVYPYNFVLERSETGIEIKVRKEEVSLE